MRVEQALAIIGSVPNGREALQCLIDDQGWVVDTKLKEFLNMNTCTDCGNRAAEYFDPRDAEIAPSPRLCAGCLKEATHGKIRQLEFEIKVLKETLRKATK